MKDNFDFSPNFTDKTNEFLRFVETEYDVELISKIDQIDSYTEWRGLISLLKKIKTRVADSNSTKNKKATRKKNDSGLPKFKVTEKICMSTLADILKEKGYPLEEMARVKPIDFVQILKVTLNGVFDDMSINLSTANAIIGRIAKGSFKW